MNGVPLPANETRRTVLELSKLMPIACRRVSDQTSSDSLRPSFEVAKHDRLAVAFGEAADLLMQDSLDFGANPVLLLIDARRHLRHASFVPPPPGSRCAGTRCRANGHLMEPWAQGIPNPETAGFLNQNQECRLERVLPVVGVDKLGAADAQDHRAVALDQGLESQLSGLAPAGRKPLE